MGNESVDTVIEHLLSFERQDEWLEWYSARQKEFTASAIAACVARVAESGVESEFWGHVPPHQIEIAGDNYCEKLRAMGLNSRQRAVSSTSKDLRSRGRNGLALALRGRFPFFIGSEYVSGAEATARLYPFRLTCGTRTCVSFPDSSTA